MTLSDNSTTISNPLFPLPICDSATFRNHGMVRTTQTLQEAASEIVRLAKGADDRTLLAAQRLVALKNRIVNGEAGPDVKWMGWLLSNVKLSSSQLYFLVSIGEARDPTQALEDHRRMKREKAKADRKKDASVPQSAERKLLLKVIKAIPELDMLEMLSKCRSKYPSLFNDQKVIH